jgi:hypothetical protein
MSDSPNNPASLPPLPTGPRRVFFGRVLPERAAVHLTGLPNIIARSESHDDTLLQIHIDSSHIVVESLGGGTMSNDELKAMVRTFVATLVDALGFTNGCGYQIEIASVGGDSTGVFGVQFGEGESDPQRIHDHSTSLITMLLSRSDGSLKPLQRALADYRRAILDESDTAFHAFRAVEALSYYFGRNPRKGTPKLCESLNVSEDWLRRKLEIPAGEIRHGKARKVDTTERLQALQDAREVILRFIAFIRRGSQLCATEFPQLEHPDELRPAGG